MIELFDKVGILFPNVLFQFINFLIFVYLMYRILYRPLRKTLQDRRERIRGSLEEAARLHEQVRQRHEEMETQLQERREEAQRVRQEVLQRVRIVEQEHVEQARGAAGRIRAEAEREAAMMKERALHEARAQLADLVIEATGKVLRRSIDDAEHRRLVREALAEVEGRSG